MSAGQWGQTGSHYSIKDLFFMGAFVTGEEHPCPPARLRAGGIFLTNLARRIDTGVD